MDHTSTPRSLLIGCGHSREKKLHFTCEPGWVGDLTTIDMSPDVGADLVMDLGATFAAGRRLPFEDATFDEIAAYDCLEHWGAQGDWRGWLAEMDEYHRILKDGGTMGIIVPVGLDALADPGHTRFFHPNHFGFLTRRLYEENEAKKTAFTDYRWAVKCWWDVVWANLSEHHLSVLLKKA